MEIKTKINAKEGKQDLLITREFDLPLELLFKAFQEREIVEQWMGSKLLKYEAKKHGSYQFEKRDEQGKVIFGANGTFHEFIPNRQITRTFEMDNAPLFGVQLDVCEFEKLTDSTSKISMHVIYESPAQRDELLKLPFAQGLNYAHNRIEELMKTFK